MRVASELLMRGYQASITFGNAKATDILITGNNNRFLRVEVKTSKNGKNFVTGYYPKYSDGTSRSPDIWVFYLPHKDADTGGDRFFMLTHQETGELQLVVNKGVKTERGKGCDNISLAMLEQERDLYENRWSLFGDLLNDELKTQN